VRQRDVFFGELNRIKDDSIVLLYGDVGGEFLDEWSKYKNNMMPSEQLMILTAAGLAKEGFKPYCFTIIPFLVFRPFEMIRLYMHHQQLPIRLVGIGAGKTYQEAGFTHWDSGDWHVVNGMDIEIWSNNYGAQENRVRESARWSYTLNKPCYIRLER